MEYIIKPGDRVLISPTAHKYVVDDMKKYLGQVVTVESVSGDCFDMADAGYTWDIKDAVLEVVTDNETTPPSTSELNDFLGF